METKNKIGTVCDNYKLEMLLKEFKDAGIEVLSHKPFTKDTTAIFCFALQSKVKPIVDKVTQHFFNKYSKDN